MSTFMADMIRTIAPEGLQINLWPLEDGYQANVKETAAKGWTCTKNDDPVEALLQALKLRAARHPGREVVSEAEAMPVQIDIEDAIAAAVARDADPLAGFGL